MRKFITIVILSFICLSRSAISEEVFISVFADRYQGPFSLVIDGEQASIIDSVGSVRSQFNVLLNKENVVTLKDRSSGKVCSYVRDERTLDSSDSDCIGHFQRPEGSNPSDAARVLFPSEGCGAVDIDLIGILKPYSKEKLLEEIAVLNEDIASYPVLVSACEGTAPEAETLDEIGNSTVKMPIREALTKLTNKDLSAFPRSWQCENLMYWPDQSPEDSELPIDVGGASALFHFATGPGEAYIVAKALRQLHGIYSLVLAPGDGCDIGGGVDFLADLNVFAVDGQFSFQRFSENIKREVSTAFSGVAQVTKAEQIPLPLSKFNYMLKLTIQGESEKLSGKKGEWVRQTLNFIPAETIENDAGQLSVYAFVDDFQHAKRAAGATRFPGDKWLTTDDPADSATAEEENTAYLQCALSSSSDLLVPGSSHPQFLLGCPDAEDSD